MLLYLHSPDEQPYRDESNREGSWVGVLVVGAYLVLALGAAFLLSLL